MRLQKCNGIREGKRKIRDEPIKIFFTPPEGGVEVERLWTALSMVFSEKDLLNALKSLEQISKTLKNPSKVLEYRP